MTEKQFNKGTVAYKVGRPGEIGQIDVSGKTYLVEFQKHEIPPGPGVEVTPCLISGDNPENRDFADINIKGGYHSPLEYYKKPIQITDYYLGGEGIFFAESPNGDVYCTVFDNSPEQIGMNITFGTNWKQSWIAKKDGPGLHFLESCVPPWPSELPYETINDPSNDERLSPHAREIYLKEVLPTLQ